MHVEQNPRAIQRSGKNRLNAMAQKWNKDAIRLLYAPHAMPT